ncbi:hypothetical protein QRD40_23770, partial [Comamonas sp. Y6]|uniref:hypothetical protein n=1 Tax=Comamonas resistens TaxID=3046670 RepID=UPI00255C23FE
NSRLRVRLTVLLRPRLLCFMSVLSGLQALASTSGVDSCRGSLGAVFHGENQAKTGLTPLQSYVERYEFQSI